MGKAVVFSKEERELLKEILSDGGSKEMLYSYWKDSMEDENLKQREVYGFQDWDKVASLHDSITSKLFKE